MNAMTIYLLAGYIGYIILAAGITHWASKKGYL